MVTPHDPKDADFIGDERHDVSWPVNIEQPEHTGDRKILIKEETATVESTVTRNHITPVTNDGTAWESLYPALAEEFGVAVDKEYIGQYGCREHVVRAYN